MSYQDAPWLARIAPESVCHQMSSKKFRTAYGWAPEVTMRSVIAQIVEQEQ